MSLLHHILYKSATQFCNNIALNYNNENCTYQELNLLSNNLAQNLINNNINYKDRIIIYLEKSIYSIIALFGILKIGAIYVPVDFNTPQKRLLSIIQDCCPTAIITTKTLYKNITNTTTEKLLKLSILTDITSKQNHLIPWKSMIENINYPHSLPQAIENDIAYILYTSGSSGTPKGVMINHRASIVFINWAIKKFQIKSTDIISNHAALNFDLSVFDIFVSLKAGAKIVLIPPHISLFPTNLAKLISEKKITIWYSVPSILIKLVLYGKLEKYNYQSIRLILFAGESFPTKFLTKLIHKIPHVNYYNLYGPTETNVCTYHKVTNSDLQYSSIPIGKNCEYNEILLIQNNKIILKKQNAQGELCVRGPNLMSGYWNLESKTSQHKKTIITQTNFPKETIYFTGDIVKINQNNLFYLGRIDNMIKSRGYRIELDEIENIIYQHDSVEKVAAIPIQDIENNNLIKVFIVKNKKYSNNFNITEIKNFCAQYLPKYMVPQLIKFCDSLPENSNGKIDKLKLKQQEKNNEYTNTTK